MPFPSKTNQETILATAIEIVEHDGIKSLSIREVARRLELAPNALYHYYKDRNELEAAIAAEGFRQLLEAIQKAAKRNKSNGATTAEPGTVLRTSHAYLRFAREHPALYQHMFRKHVPTPGLLAVLDEHETFSKWLLGWMGSSKLVAEGRFALFAMLHGIVTLQREEVLEGSLKRDTDRAISALLIGLSQSAGSTAERRVGALERST